MTIKICDVMGTIGYVWNRYTKSIIEKDPMTKEIFPSADDMTIIDIIEPTMANGPWIAGGACIHWLSNPYVSVSGITDIDVYVKDTDQLNFLRQKILTSSRYSSSLVSNTGNAVTFKIVGPKTWIVQIIKVHTGNTPAEVLDDFDIQACKIITDGHNIYAEPNALDDAANKIIRINNIKEDSVRRITKYLMKGYSLDEDTFNRLSSFPEVNWDFEYEPGEY